MNKQEYLLTKLSEECAEVAQRVSKILCFGIDEKEPGQELTNEQRLKGEYYDLLAVFEMLEDEGFVIQDANFEVRQAMINKKAKVKKFMEYSRTQGRLSNE